MLQPNLTRVTAAGPLTLRLTYETGEEKLFDVSPYADGPWYGELRNPSYFRAVRLLPGGTGIEWPHGQDIAPHELYELGEPSGTGNEYGGAVGSGPTAPPIFLLRFPLFRRIMRASQDKTMQRAGKHMFFDGYEPLSLTADEIEMLKTLRRLADKSGFEYGFAAQLAGETTGKLLWKSEVFTSHNHNLVEIPKSVLLRDSISLYHAHTNNTLFSAKDLKLLLRKNIRKVCVIATSYNTAVVWTNTGYYPDEKEFTEIAGRIQRMVPVELMNHPNFYDWTQEERVNCAIQEQAFQIARYFKWTLEGGTV